VSQEARWAEVGPDWRDPLEALAFADWLEEQGKEVPALLTRWAVHAARWPARDGGIWAWGSSVNKGTLFRHPHALPTPIYRVLYHRWHWYTMAHPMTPEGALQRLINVEVKVTPTLFLSKLLLPIPESVLESDSLDPDYLRRLLARPDPARHWPPEPYLDLAVARGARLLPEDGPGA
jgi:hypothetical protein